MKKNNINIQEMTLSELFLTVQFLRDKIEEQQIELEQLKKQYVDKKTQPQLISIKQAARLLNMNYEVFRRKLLSGEIALTATKIGKSYKLKRSDVENYINQLFEV